MNKKYSQMAYIALVAVCAVSSVSVAQAASVSVSVTDLPVNVKARMQAELASSTNGSIRGEGDGRMYKGGNLEVNGEVRGNAQSMGSSSRSEVATKILADKDTPKVESDDDSVKVSYKVPAKLFGFIPMGMVVRTTIGSAGEVKVSHPWYSFLTASDDTSVQADIMSEVEAIKTEFGVTAGTKLSTSTKSDFIRAVHDLLKSALDARVSANASTSVQ